MKGFIYVLLLSLFIPINGYPGTKKTDANAFRQSEKLLKLAATELVDAITASDYPMWKEFPDRKKIILNILPYENLVRFPGKDEIYKNGVLLSMDHQINPNLIMIYKPFFVMYAGTADSEFEKKAVEVKKDLLMEASLTWGFDENQAETFADDFLQIKKATSKKLRPEESIFVKPDYCSCLDGKPDINNQCTSFCKGSYGGPTLYGSVILGEKVILDETLGSLERWCNAEISVVPGVAPKCVLEVDDGKSKEYLDITLPPKSNNFTVNINTLKMNVTYVARIVETGSNTNNASSDAFQIRRMPPPPTNTFFPGPLKITPVSQYTCVTRIGESDPATQSHYFDLKAINHYYFAPRNVPSRQVSSPSHFCYDINKYGPVDNAKIPRLELIPDAFHLWDVTDIRFSDTNGDGNADINNLIDTEMLVKYGIEAKTNYFVPLKWPTAPSFSVEGTMETAGEGTIGYMMRVFIDPYTGVGKCPTQKDYFGADPTFQALRGVVGVDTEAIYVGIREKQTLNNPDGTTAEIPPDIILINESLLKQIWFYIENNLRIKPDDVTSSQQTIYFYYPPAPGYIDPYVQKSYQELYTVRDRTSFGAQNNEGTDATTQGLPSYDKRYGCIPNFANSNTNPNEDKYPTNNSMGEIITVDPGISTPQITDPKPIPDRSESEDTIKCTREICIDHGYDCCIDNKCVKDKSEKTNINKLSLEYLQSVRDIKNDPFKILNYPYLYNICPTPSENTPVPPIEESSNSLNDAKLRFSIQKAQYLCQEEGKQQNPNYELFCNNKYLCLKLWKKSEPSFDGNCADLDRKSGFERYKEIRQRTIELCGCNTKVMPEVVEDQKCPDFIWKAIQDSDGNIKEFVCSVPDTKNYLTPR